MRIKQLLKNTLLVAAGLLVGASNAWGANAVETYDFTLAAHQGNFSYNETYVTYSNSTWGYRSTNDWLNGRFSFADGKSSGVHRNYWTVRTFSTNNKNCTGLNYTQSTARQFAIHNLKDGDVIIINNTSAATAKLSSLTTNIKAEGGSDVLAAGTELTYGDRYVVSTSDESTIVEIMGAQYCCVTSIQIQTTETETITAPTFDVAVDGTSRKVTINGGISNSFGNAVITYYTTDGSDPTTESDVYSEPLTISNNCTVKAISVAYGGTVSSVASQEVTVGKLELNQAECVHSAAGVYTLSSNQSDVETTPNATIHYTIGNGAEQTSTDASINVNVTENSTLTYWLTATGFDATEHVTINAYAPLTKGQLATINFCTSNSNDWAKQGDAVTVDGDNSEFYQYKDQSNNILGNGLLATTFNYKDTEKGFYAWRIQRYYGGTAPYNATEKMALLNLKKNCIVQFQCGLEPSAVTNLVACPEETYTGFYAYKVVADGDVVAAFAKSNVIKSIKVYKEYDSELSIIGSLDQSSNYRSIYGEEITLKKGDAYKFTFDNHGSMGQNYYNWVMDFNINSNFKATLRADWAELRAQGDETAGAFENPYTVSENGGDNTSVNWTTFQSDMMDANVELNISYTTAGKVVINGTMTSGSRVYNYNWAYDQNLSAPISFKLSMEKAWIAVKDYEKTAVGATTTSAGKGWATLYTDKALDFSGVEGLTAYTASLDNNTVTLNKVNDIQAETGVVLKSSTTDANTTYSIPVFASSTTVKGNLTGNAAESTELAENTAYILGINSNTGKAQFFINSAGTIAAGKAYLPVVGSAKALSVVFANDPTGIATVNAAETTQPVKRIMNGQLVIEKNGKRYNAAGAEF